MNPKFIPVLPPNGNIEHIPLSLRGSQRYQPFSKDGYQDLYRRLTSQPAVLMPAMGKRKVLSPTQPTQASQPTSLVSVEVVCNSSKRAAILMCGDDLQAFVPVLESQWGEREAVMLLEPDYPEAASFLETLRTRQDVRMAYRSNVAIGAVEDTQHVSKNGRCLPSSRSRCQRSSKTPTRT